MNLRLKRIILATALFAAAMMMESTGGFPLWQLLLAYLMPYLIVGYDVIGEAVDAVRHGRGLDEHFLMTIATLGALVIGFMPGADNEFAEAVFVMLFFQVGELFEHYAEDKSRRSVTRLMDLRPDTAHVIRCGTEHTVDPATVAVGETIIVKQGERVALDGRVTSGRSTLNTAALTGESELRSVAPGDDIVSGCINMGDHLTIVTTKCFGESTVAKIIDLVENAAEKKSKREAFITRFARVYTPIVVGLAAAMIIIAPIICCCLPCSCHPGHEGAAFIPHPTFFTDWLSRALTFLVVSCPCALVISIPLTFFCGIGGASRRGILVKGATHMETLSRLKAVVFDKTGTLTDSDNRVKSKAREAIQQLRRLGISRIVMLSGDREETVSRVAADVGIDHYRAQLLPADKVAEVERIDGRPLAFVGDGINDAPVLARADVGIAMGALGSDAAIEAADVVLMDDNPRKVALAVHIARKTLCIATENTVFAIAVKIGVLLLAAAGIATMWMAAFADVGVTVIAVFNAMRAWRGR